MGKGREGAGGRLKRAGDSCVNGCTTWLVGCPCVFLFITVTLMFAVTTIVVSTGNAELSEQSSYDWFVPEKDSVINMDALASAQGDVDKISSLNVTERTNMDQEFIFFYKLENCNSRSIFTARTVQVMCETEAILWNHEDWSSFCWADENGDCVDPMSATNFFYGSGHNFSCPLLAENDVTSAANTLYSSLSTTAGMLTNGFYVDEGAPTDGQTCYTRSLFRFGSPLAGYSKQSVIGDKQFLEMVEVAGEIAEDLKKKFGMEASMMNPNDFPIMFKSAYMDEAKDEGMQILWHAYTIQDLEFTVIVATDMYASIFSILFVWIWISVHTGSLFIGSFGIMQIFLSIPVSLFLYRMVFQVLFFETLQTLVIFVILGVGADDIFVMVDAWKQSAEEFPEAGGSNRESGISAQALSDVKPTSKLWRPLRGRYVEPARAQRIHQRMKYAYARALQAVFNTSFTTAMAFIATSISPIMPISTFGIFAALCILMNYLFVMTLTPATIIVHEIYLKDFFGFCPTGLCGKVGKDTVKQDQASETCIDKLLTTHKKQAKAGSVGLMLALLGYAIFCAISASTLTPPREQEQWFPDEHMLYRAIVMNDEYLSGDDDTYAHFYIVYGIKGVDRSDFNIYEPGKNRGDAKYDSRLDLSQHSAQHAFLEACDAVREWTCDERGCDYGLLVRPDSTVCFLEEFQTWHNATYGATTYEITSNQFYTRLEIFRNSEAPTVGSSTTYENMIGFIDGDLKFITIEARMTMKRLQSVSVKAPILERAEKLVDSLDSVSGLPKPFQYTWDWVWFETENGLLYGLMIGMAIAFPVAFLTLTLATSNVYIALLAIATIGCVVACVLGSVRAYLSWDLGIAESVAGVIVIGLAVDYTIHLGHMYDHARIEKGEYTREGRFKFAVNKMGTTVFAGAITTAGSGMFLFLTQLIFFSKMGTLIVLTIIYSIIFSFGFFMTSMYLVGPEGDFGRNPFAAKTDYEKPLARLHSRAGEAELALTTLNDKTPMDSPL